VNLSIEEKYIFKTIISARRIQNFLWGVASGSWGLEEWRRMFIKRVKKIEIIDKNNPHAMVELKKRLLQNAALSVALLAILHDKQELSEASVIPSNLPEYTSYEKSQQNSNVAAAADEMAVQAMIEEGEN